MDCIGGPIELLREKVKNASGRIGIFVNELKNSIFGISLVVG